MLIYSQSKGTLLGGDKGVTLAAFRLLGTGYSGRGAGRNNPDMQDVRGVGPIPRGFYRVGKPYDSAKTGPFTVPLYALDATPFNDIVDANGRSAFRAHGNNARNDASEGCIIQARNVREQFVNHEILWVIA